MGVPIDPTPEMLAQVRAAMLVIRDVVRGPRDAVEVFAEIDARMQADHRERVRRWERDAPMRERAERAMQLGYARRAAAESGTRSAGRVPVLAALWADEPQRPKVW
jgi:hypothetical protein